MKLSMSIDRYDIKALDSITNTMTDFKSKISFLETIAIMMNSQLDTAGEDFDSVNYERAKLVIDSFLKKMREMDFEITELSESCIAFAEKIQMIWR